MDLNAYLSEISYLSSKRGSPLRDGWMKLMKETLNGVNSRMEWIAKIDVILSTEGLDLSKIYEGKEQVYTCFDRFSFSKDRLTQAIETERIDGEEQIRLTDMSSKAKVVLDMKGRVHVETVEDYLLEKGLIYSGYARLDEDKDIYFFNVYNEMYPNLLTDGTPEKTGLTCRQCGQEVTLETQCVSYRFRCNPCDAPRWREECIEDKEKSVEKKVIFESEEDVEVKNASGVLLYTVHIPRDVNFDTLSNGFNITNNSYTGDLASFLYAIYKRTMGSAFRITDHNGSSVETLTLGGNKFSDYAEFSSGFAAIRMEESDEVLLEVWDENLRIPLEDKEVVYSEMRDNINNGIYYLVTKLGLNGKRTVEFPTERIIIESSDSSLMSEVYDLIADDSLLKSSSDGLISVLEHIGIEYSSVKTDELPDKCVKYMVSADPRDGANFKIGSFVVYNNGLDYHPAVVRGSFLSEGKLSYLLFVCSEGGSDYQATTSGENLFLTMEDSFAHFRKAKKLEFEELNNSVIECQVKVLGGAKC